MRAICNKGCLKTFTVEVQEIKSEGSIVETYFECTECGHHYTMHVKDDEVRTLQSHIEYLQRKPKKTQADNQDVLRMQKEVNERMKQLKEELVGNG